MKLSWPYYLTLTFGLFMAFIIFLVIKTFRVNNELVTEDYYKQELAYQDMINQRSHVTTANDVVITQTPQAVILSFPSLSAQNVQEGSICFYRPSDAAKDLRVPLQVNTKGEQVFLKKLFAKGLYKLKAEWKEDGTAMYSEKDLYIQ